MLREYICSFLIDITSITVSLLSEKGCIFNISADPLENNDLWYILPDRVNDLIIRLRVIWAGMKPRSEPKRDARADPSLNNFIWSPWVQNEDFKQQYNNTPPFPLQFSQKELQYIFNLNIGTFSEKLCRLIKNMGDSFIKSVGNLFY